MWGFFWYLVGFFLPKKRVVFGTNWVFLYAPRSIWYVLQPLMVVALIGYLTVWHNGHQVLGLWGNWEIGIFAIRYLRVC